MGTAKRYRVRCGGTLVRCSGTVQRYDGTVQRCSGTVQGYTGTVQSHPCTAPKKTQQKHNQFLNAFSKIEGFVENWLCFCCVFLVRCRGTPAPYHCTLKNWLCFCCVFLVRCRGATVPYHCTLKNWLFFCCVFLGAVQGCDCTVPLYPCTVPLYLCTVPPYLCTVPLHRTTVPPHRTLYLLAVPPTVPLLKLSPRAWLLNLDNFKQRKQNQANKAHGHLHPPRFRYNKALGKGPWKL